jgi:DNA adenine methylase
MPETTRYPGGKGTCYKRIINLMPPHKTYIETHAGGGSVILNKHPADINIAIDVDPSAKEIFRQNNPGNPVRFYTADCQKYLRGLLPAADTLIYADPPYLMSTRKSGSLYKFEYTEQQHVELLQLLLSLKPSMVMISGYWSRLYADMLRAWNTISFETMTRRGMATEWVWFNFDIPEQLHDYSHLGDNFRDRERITRKQKRWIANLQNMPTVERNALLDRIHNTFEGESC